MLQSHKIKLVSQQIVVFQDAPTTYTLCKLEKCASYCSQNFFTHAPNHTRFFLISLNFPPNSYEFIKVIDRKKKKKSWWHIRGMAIKRGQRKRNTEPCATRTRLLRGKLLPRGFATRIRSYARPQKRAFSKARRTGHEASVTKCNATVLPD